MRRVAPPTAARVQARARRIEREIDELLWQVAAESDDPASPAELGPERIARDVERWRRTVASRPGVRPRANGLWPRAAAAVLALCAVGAGGYWAAGVTAGGSGGVRAYVHVARAPGARPEQGWQRDARACSSESWYCVVSFDSSQREL